MHRVAKKKKGEIKENGAVRKSLNGNVLSI